MMLIGNCWSSEQWRFHDDHTANSSTAKLINEIPCAQQRYRGLGWDKKFGCWRVRVFYAGRQRHVGRFKDDLTAARAYNKVVSFLYGDKAILNIVPQAEDCVDTFDIPSAIRLAKLEAQQAASSGSNISTSSSSNITNSSRSPTSMSSTNTNISSNSMAQYMASGASQHAMRDSYYVRSNSSALLPGPHFLEPSWQTAPVSAASLLPGSAALLAPDSGLMVLPSGPELSTYGLNTSTSTSGLQDLALSAAFLQDGTLAYLHDGNTGFLQDVSTGLLQSVSTGCLQDISTGFLQDNILPMNSSALQALNMQACMISTEAPATPAQLLGLQQQSVAHAIASMPLAGPACYPVLPPSLSMPLMPSSSTYNVPMASELVASSACQPGMMPIMHSLGEPVEPYACALGTSGVVMGFPVGGVIEPQPLVSMQALQGYGPAHHASSCTAAASVHPVPVSSNNGVSVEFAPPLPV